MEGGFHLNYDIISEYGGIYSNDDMLVFERFCAFLAKL